MIRPMREITVGVVAPAFVNLPLWVVTEEFALDAVCVRLPAERAVLTPFIRALAEAASRLRGHIGESAAIAAMRTSIEPRYALRACQVLAEGPDPLAALDYSYL